MSLINYYGPKIKNDIINYMNENSVLNMGATKYSSIETIIEDVAAHYEIPIEFLDELSDLALIIYNKNYKYKLDLPNHDEKENLLPEI
ncbi:MAG: hypothetical protein GY756_26090 [bacterium]|nr:hypothetical protein [bacterium]